MDGFEAHGYFEFAGQLFCELEAALAYERWVTFDDGSLEACDSVGYGWMVFGRDGFGVEEAAAVVELDLAGGRELLEGVVDLRGNGSEGHGFSEGVLPEVAHEATPGTLSVGEEDGGYRKDFACGCVLVFDEEGVGTRGVERVSLRTLRENPLVAVVAALWVGREDAHW